MALPAFMYRDPAEVVERMELDELGCRICSSGESTFLRMVCGDARNEKQKGVPFIGHRCKWFSERVSNGS
jgi:hypothetical protein